MKSFPLLPNVLKEEREYIELRHLRFNSRILLIVYLVITVFLLTNNLFISVNFSFGFMCSLSQFSRQNNYPYSYPTLVFQRRQTKVTESMVNNKRY